MDKAGKDFLINDELERHLESMYNALGEIDSRQESKVVHRAGVIMMSALIGGVARVGMRLRTSRRNVSISFESSFLTSKRPRRMTRSGVSFAWSVPTPLSGVTVRGP